MSSETPIPKIKPNLNRLSQLILILASAILFSCPSWAENLIQSKLHIPDSLHSQIISLDDGSEIYGKVTAIQSDSISFKSSLGETKISINRISNIRDVLTSEYQIGKYRFADPNQTRLYFTQTGKMLRRGEWYFSDIFIFFPSVSVGLSDKITAGAGMSIFPGVDIGDQAYYFTPKIGIKASEKTNLAVGAIIISIPDDIDDDDNIPTFGLLYGVGTFGPPKANFTAGLGYGFAGNHLADKPAVLLGGNFRMGNRISFITENWVFPETDHPLVSYGFRFFGDKLAVDLGLFNVIGEDAVFPGVPWIDFVVNIR